MRRRVLSLRATLMLTIGVTFAVTAIVAVVLVQRVLPQARRVTERSEAARADFALRTNYTAAIDSVVSDMGVLVRRARTAPIPQDSLTPRRRRLEAVIKSSSMLTPTRRLDASDRSISGYLDQADGSALTVLGSLLGAAAMLEVNDVASATVLYDDAIRQRSELMQNLGLVTVTAFQELTRTEAAVGREARITAWLVVAWLLLGGLLVPMTWRLLNQRLFVPLVALDRSLTRIQQGDLDVELHVSRDDEIGRLEAHFNRTTTVLREQRALTERAAARAGQEASEARYRAAFEQAEVGLAEIGLDRRYVRVNRAMCHVLGRNADEILGHSFAEFTHPDDQAADEVAWPRMVRGEQQVARVEKRYVRSDGDIASVQLTATMLHDADGSPRHVLAVVYDVTAQRRLERELLQAKKLDAVGQLAGGVAHDFNNLLMGIIGYADLLEHDAAALPDAKDDIVAIRQAALRGADLAKSLLALARRTPQRREPFKMQGVVRETADLAQRTFDRRIELRVRADVDATISGDRSLVSNALLNLTLNARDAMPEGGLLRIAASVEDVSAEFRRRHDLQHDGHFVVIQVSDTGTGMTPDVLEHVFEPFFTTKAAGKGTGLGLAMVYGTVRDHGGAITVDSALGRGTTFTVYLPCDATAVVPVTPTSTPLTAAAPSRVLIVDDEEVVRDVAARMLERLGYRTETARDGLAAIARLSGTEHDIDLVVLDGNMPRLNGLETARRIKALHPHLPIIFATGYLQAETDATLDTLGFFDRLQKPYTIDNLSRVVARALSRRDASAV